MTISMYQSTVAVFIRQLENLSAILKKSEAHAEAKKIDPTILLNARLFPDMLPLTRQIQIACDAVKFGAGRIAEVEMPVFEDVEKSFPELCERITKTIKFLQTIKPEQIDEKEALKITYTQRNKENNFIGQPYLLNYVLPNLYFHISIAYAILRHNGVEIGKKDYLGNL